MCVWLVVQTVASWLADDESLASLSQKAKEAARPSSTTDIAREIGDLLFGDWQLPSRKDTEEKFRLLLKKVGFFLKAHGCQGGREEGREGPGAHHDGGACSPRWARCCCCC